MELTFDQWVTNKLLDHYPGISKYVDLVPSAIDRFGRDEEVVNYSEKNKNRYVFGTRKHIAVLHHLYDIIAESDPDIEEAYQEVKPLFGEIFDWNQRRLIEKRTKDIIVDLSLRQQDIVNHNIVRTISKEFPLRNINMAEVPNYRDYRLPKNRMDLAIRNHMVRMLGGDLDHWHSAYVAADYLNLTEEEKAWYAMYFGFSYRTQWATIAIQIFGAGKVDPDLVDWWTGWSPDESGELQHNGVDNYALIPVGKDCRYNKNNWHKCYRGLHEYAEGDLLGKLKAAATSSDDPNENFRNLAWEIQQLPRFGRMTTFLAMQQLYQFFDWPINGYEMMLGDSNTWSSRIGLYWLIGDEFIPEQEVIDIGTPSPSPEELEHLNKKTEDILAEMNEEMPFLTDVFNLESEECECFDKMFLKSRETNYWAMLEMNELVEYAVEDWTKYNEWVLENKDTIPSTLHSLVDLKPLVLAQFTKRPLEILGSWPDNRWYLTAMHLGIPTQLHYSFADEPNLYEHVEIGNPGEIMCEGIVNMWNSWFTEVEKSTYRDKYDPRLFLKWKKNIDKDSKYYKALIQEEKDFIETLPELEKQDKLYFNRV